MKLKWGQTHWNNMNQKKLIREAQKMYSAIISMESVLKMIGTTEGNNPFWGESGSAGRALNKSRQIIRPLEKKYGDDYQMYGNFYRYANSLLFEGEEKWEICPKCGKMIGSISDIGKKCTESFGGKKDCLGIMRELKWKDLEPVNSITPLKGKE